MPNLPLLRVAIGVRATSSVVAQTSTVSVTACAGVEVGMAQP